MPATPEAFTHDADGNLTADARWSYTWDGENRLIAMETTAAAAAAGVARRKLEFAYDSQSRRIAKQVYAWNGAAWGLDSSLLFLYDGWNLLAEMKADSLSPLTFTLTRSYVWGLDLSGSFQGAGGVGGLLFTTYSLNLAPYSAAAAYDGNGNVIGYVDMATGAKSATYEYGAFGETLVADGPLAEVFTFRFSTKYHDAETSRLYYGLRYYSSGTGRWLSRDPITERGGSNLYSFCHNTPLNGVDALGLAFTRATTRPPVVGAVTNGNHAGETSLKFVGYLNEIKRGRTFKDCHELVLEGSVESIIVYRSVADQSDTSPDGTGRTTAQHEAHHAELNSREWERFISEANPYEKKYCSLNCVSASRSAVSALRDLFLARRNLVNAEFDWEAYANNPKYGMHDISERELSTYRVALRAAEEKLDQKKAEMEEACR